MKRGEATRQALLRAARDEFAEYGLAGARVDRVAEQAGVNKERIYSLFGSKDKLFDAILIDTMQEFTELVDPLDTEIELGDYVSRLYEFHRHHPQLQRLLLWEALHRGDDAHDIDGWRNAHYRKKIVAAMARFGADEKQAGLLLMALASLVNWPNALPQVNRLLLGESAGDRDAIRRFLVSFVRAAVRGHESEAESVKALTTDVEQAAARLRRAQAETDRARAELAHALRAANTDGESANQLAKRVAGTLSRPVVLKLLAEEPAA
ncbi:TetR/AcrR family transcriptional regulator [Stackebrandtia nassauensis]|uniref:Transcriptional regulator, TetR family n=1 Tax=Stackebrandtia nassauensis (strain DSM 44728 / CIP 108903 / NRRL B-16338 / NBRC 102104 / LLR-40K-21) TaxID=446470 RepID=D3Q5K7_STANL|nr:TetR family transcriptional regulator [Stackebrandtia nassauensis]ADD46067.1 transcriptional regulator, TetR family [Stackebrandtia nassauensis DSM 44728]